MKFNKPQKQNLIRSASYASVIVAFAIMSIKSFAWIETYSQSVLASLIDSLLDITSSLINLVVVRLTLRPPDDKHRFGHEKFQDLAIFSQSIFFMASSFVVLFTSLKSLYYGATLGNVGIAIAVNIIYVCIGLTLALVLYQAYVVRHTNSKIIEADKLHYFADFLTNVAVVLSLYLSSRFWYIDGIVGICISFYIMHTAYILFKGAIHNLSDQEFHKKDRKKILNIISNFKDVVGVHELKTRSASSKPFIQFHLELNGNLSLQVAHDISDEVADALMEDFPDAEIIIHQDPVEITDKK